MMNFRQIPPTISSIEQIFIHPMEAKKLSNGITLYFLNQGDQDISRIDLIIEAGKWQQSKPLVSSFTNLMLKEGAGNLSGNEIAEKLDYCGAWLQLSDGYHFSYLTVYTLNKFFKEIFDILILIFREPIFPEEAFNALRKRHKQQFLIDNDKVQYIATKKFTEKLFGENHPYGKTAKPEDFKNISKDDLKDFHQKYYRSSNISMILSGKIDEKMLQYTELSLQDYLPINLSTNIHQENISVIPPIQGNRRLFIPKEDALQNGIRMGLPVINRSHPDFPGLRVVNTILGGYFGSRLMSNIREEKGYTYGISSGIMALKNAAYLSIATQTACEHTDVLIEEVYKEIERLQEKTVGLQELNMVRNYMLGDFVRSLDGTFSLADAHISLLASDLNIDFLYKQIDTVKKITPEEIKMLAQRYLKKEAFIEVIAGK